jgi:hypothetical protein
MSYKDKEKRIKQERTIEATKKGLMGFEGKLGVIVRNMGQPIISHEDASCPDLGSTEFFEYSGKTLDEILGREPEGIPTIEQYDKTGNAVAAPEGWEWTQGGRRQAVAAKSLGWHFDGLSRGHHLEIKLMGNELTCMFKGYLVYAETGGDLKAFVPNKDWEDRVETLYKVAKKKDDSVAKEEKAERIVESVKDKADFLQKIKTFWGV